MMKDGDTRQRMQGGLECEIDNLIRMMRGRSTVKQLWQQYISKAVLCFDHQF